MAEENTNEISESKNQNDWLLESYVAGLNQNEDSNISITLCIKGAVVTGYLIGGLKYFKELDQLFNDLINQKDEDSKKELHNYYTEMAEKIYTNKSESPKQTIPPPTYIHLEKARILIGNTQYKVGLWRGKLKEVDGFSFGGIVD